MESESCEWVNLYGVKILEGVSEVHYSASGGEIFLHGEISYLCEDSNALNLDTIEQERIIVKRQAKQQASYGYIISNVFLVSCIYNINSDIKYGSPINLQEFFAKNGIADFKAVTPNMLINWPHTQWEWSMERDLNVSEEDMELMF